MPRDRQRERRVDVSGGAAPLGQEAFGGLDIPGLPDGETPPAVGCGPANEIPAGRRARRQAKKPPPRVNLRREKSGRGGKTVTVVYGFAGLGAGDLEALAKRLKAICGTGGTSKDGRIEIQGDHRARLSEVLAEMGYRPVLSGG